MNVIYSFYLMQQTLHSHQNFLFPPLLCFNVIACHGLLLWGFAITLLGHTTVGRTPLDKLEAQHGDLYLATQHS
jgi:hypothetical protein